MKVLLFGAILFYGFLCLGKVSEMSEMSIFHLSSKWKNESGKEMKLKEFFMGKPTLIAMVYTSCKHTCPMITSKVIRIQRKLPGPMQKKIQLALIFHI